MMGEGGGGRGGQPKSVQIKFSHLTSLSTSSRLNDSQVKCSLYKGGVTLQIAPIKYWGGSTTSSQIYSQKKLALVEV